MATQTGAGHKARDGVMTRFLDVVERVGNRIPHSVTVAYGLTARTITSWADLPAFMAKGIV